MLADLVLIAGLLVAAAGTLAWLALVVFGLSQPAGTRFLPRPVWLLLCLFSPVGAVVYLTVGGAWRHRPHVPVRRGG
jgi:hypothetical protein